jgi:L-lactate dehydrogenase complex protein LldF
MLSHSEASENFIADAERTDWHDETLWFVRAKRDKASKVLPEWEAMREHASQIKDHTLANLGEYLQAFEAKAIANGIHVHWAADATEHNAIVHSIIAAQGSKTIVKSKSMLTEECHLNDYLASKGIEVVDTDLGERIVQFRNEAPSHIVLPAIHLKKEDVGETFHQHLGTPKGNKDPQFLTEAARQHLRGYFLASEVAITGVNFAVAETGEFVVCTNEGNADMGAHLAKVHIACTGIEKIIPKRADLAVFLRLLARSATGQLITTYSSHFHKPREGQEMHIVLLDNGRTRQLADPKYKNSLKCIRCAACFNTCPVYRRSGGHSYHQPVAGPIGSILAPNIDKKANADLPFASTLCGSCSNVCPVKINIHEQLWFWRQDLMEAGLAPAGKTLGMKLMAFTLANPVIYRIGGSLMRRFSALLNNSLNPWYKQREMPVAPKESFQEWYKKR